MKIGSGGVDSTLARWVLTPFHPASRVSWRPSASKVDQIDAVDVPLMLDVPFMSFMSPLYVLLMSFSFDKSDRMQILIIARSLATSND